MTPNKAVPLLTRTAPERIWLQVGDDALCPESDEFPLDHEGITWCDTPIMAQEVEYIRADIPATERVDVEQVQAVIAEMEACGARGWADNWLVRKWADELTAAIGDKK